MTITISTNFGSKNKAANTYLILDLLLHRLSIVSAMQDTCVC